MNHDLDRLQAIWDREGQGWRQFHADCRAAGVDTRAWPLAAVLAFFGVLGIIGVMA